MSNEELLIKRFNSLVGKIPVPNVFKSELSKEAYLALFELPEITVEFVENTLSGYYLHLSTNDFLEYSKLDEVNRCLYLLDNCQEARDHCKRYFKGRESQ